MAFGFFVRQVVAGLGPWNMVRVGGALTGGGLIGAGLPLHWMLTAGCFFVIGFGFYMMHNAIMLRSHGAQPASSRGRCAVGAFAFTTGQGLGPMIWALAAGSTILYGDVLERGCADRRIGLDGG